jgi:hypothetical protein
MNRFFEIITSLEYRLKAARAEAAAFKSGKKYLDMQEKHDKTVRSFERRIKEQDKELAGARREIITVRNQWFEVFGNLEKEFNQKRSAALKEIEQLKKRLFKTQGQLDEALDKVKEQRLELYKLKTELEEEKGRNLQLRAQMNRDYENSSLPSSLSVKHKKIQNSREKTGRKPGGQPGHAGHSRKKQVPTTDPVLLPPPQEVVEDPDFKKTSKLIVKQLVNMRVQLEVTEYQADVYYNSKTGERIHAEFPCGIG